MMMIGGRDNVISGDMGGFGGGFCSACGYFFIVFLIVEGGGCLRGGLEGGVGLWWVQKTENVAFLKYQRWVVIFTEYCLFSIQ